MKPIGENTAITLGAVVVVIAVSAWMTTIAAKGEAMEARLSQIEPIVREDHNQILEQSGDIKVIRGIVERLDRKAGP